MNQAEEYQNIQKKEVLYQKQMENIIQDHEGYITPTYTQYQEIYQKYRKGFSQKTFFINENYHRHPLGYKNGGKICGDEEHVKKLRSVGKQMIKLIGKKIISGDFNLTKISFPIKVMVPKTALQNSTYSCCMNPYFMKKASQTKDPVERMKLVITNSVSAFYYMNLFLKPLNPVIGETLQGHYPDGTKIYCQQISHHPPISYFLSVGPNNSYKYYGCYEFSAHAGLNSLRLENKGYKVFQFSDGDKIQATFNQEEFSGLFIGTVRSQGTQNMKFVNKKYDIQAEIQFDKVKKRPSDYFVSKIYKKGKVVSEFDGTYCGYINFDGVRYWDGRFINPFKLIYDESSLKSDSGKRKDLILLKENNLQEAQKAKQQIQEKQRKDAKLREKALKKK